MRNRCQVLPDERTTRRKAHGDGPSLAQSVLDRISYTTDGWCKLVNLAANKSGGYPQVSSGGANKFATLGEVLLWSMGISKPELPIGTPGSAVPDVSHLCARPRCKTGGHVCLESKAENNARKGCIVWVACSTTCARCHGARVILVCSHGPPCIRSHPGYESQENFLANAICRDDSDTFREVVKRQKLAVAGPSKPKSGGASKN